MTPAGGPVRPVFFDETRRRWYWVVRVAAILASILLVAVVIFVVSLWALPLLPHRLLPRAKEARDTGNADPVANAHQMRARSYAQKRDKRKLAKEIEREHKREEAAARANDLALRQIYGPPAPGETRRPIVAGFYVNWEETSRASLRRNIDQLTHVLPEWLHLTADGVGFSDARTQEDKLDIEPFIRMHHLPIVPVLNNYVPNYPGAEQGHWSTQAVHNLITDPVVRSAFISDLRSYLLARGWQGINIDFEEVDPDDRDALTEFMAELSRRLRPDGLVVSQDIEIESQAYDLERLALWNNFLIPMFYDQHSPGDEAGPGSIAGISWTKREMKKLLARVPANKIVMGIGSYAYDWTKGDNKDAASLTYQAAVIQAAESVDPKDPDIAKVKIDPASLNPYYRYYDDGGAEHVVWMLDATTAYNQWQVVRGTHPRGVALWCLGAEDPGVWSVIGRSALTTNMGPFIDTGLLNTISYGKQAQVDFEGEGELLEVLAEPSVGERVVTRDPRSGLITHETYLKYPSDYVVRRYGYRPKEVVLTFDDGPDPLYTPRILDILKREGVHATFFIVGKHAEENPGIVARMWDEGHEIGNHTYTHPNLALMSDQRTLLEINLTQRVIEAITGHSTTLFRPPYAIDVEPRTGGELKPVILASKLGYLAVGEMNDPQDWKLTKKGPNGEILPRTWRDIVQSVWANRNVGSIILLHDGGGNREATVAALPHIIEMLKKAGFRFITLSQLRGLPREDLFPSIRGREELLVGVDKWLFETSYVAQRTLTTLFALSVLLGVSRQLFITILALVQRRRERRRAFLAPDDYHPRVSVLVAAYNEAAVIERTVEAVLASRYPHLEVIVVDDGSTDATCEVVRERWREDARVCCLRKPNGGKASALNLGLREATGEVLVALDADTILTPSAIPLLVRHFRDASVGAVSGNVRVGNVRNILTRWQALEYITSQNFDRRAYELLNCITVVPGAIGAWRRSAVEEVGGYTSETLAEDTDLTWRIRRAGYRILNDSSAVAYTEAPETLRNLSRQRFRWAFGTLQNLWKHRDALFNYGAFGWIALPSLWLYQIVFPAISPVMDVTVVWALFVGNAWRILEYLALMIGVEMLGAAVALTMDRGRWSLLPWLALQRFVYRQLMYYVILRSLVTAVRGSAVGWNKFERRGTARLDETTPPVQPKLGV